MADTVAGVFLVQLAATWAMVGVIWMVQLVQYPLFAHAGASDFARFHAGHSVRITWVVAPLMALELATAAWLVVARPAWIPAVEAQAGLALAVGTWASTGLVQVPQHARLACGFDGGVHRRLVAGNWLRTLLWSLRGALVLAWVQRLVAR